MNLKLTNIEFVRIQDYFLKFCRTSKLLKVI